MAVPNSIYTKTLLLPTPMQQGMHKTKDSNRISRQSETEQSPVLMQNQHTRELISAFYWLLYCVQLECASPRRKQDPYKTTAVCILHN